jgi:hypothetical protein
VTVAHEVFSHTAASIAAERAEQRAREVLRRARLACLDGLTDKSSVHGLAFDEVHGAGVGLTVAQNVRDGGRLLIEATRRLVLACDALEKMLPALDAKGKR